MAYIKKEWKVGTFQKGDSEFVEGLNHIETGLADTSAASTKVIANPEGTATNALSSIQVGEDKFKIPSYTQLYRHVIFAETAGFGTYTFYTSSSSKFTSMTQIWESWKSGYIISGTKVITGATLERFLISAISKTSTSPVKYTITFIGASEIQSSELADVPSGFEDTVTAV